VRLAALADPLGLGALGDLTEAQAALCKRPAFSARPYTTCKSTGRSLEECVALVHNPDCQASWWEKRNNSPCPAFKSACTGCGGTYPLAPDVPADFVLDCSGAGVAASGGSAAAGAVSSLFSSVTGGAASPFGGVPSWVWYAAGGAVVLGLVMSRRGK
jgi:hypothetical protein